MDFKQAPLSLIKQLEELPIKVQREQMMTIRRRTPVRTGTAVNGWEFQGTDIVNDVHYVWFLEFGSRNNKAVGMVRTTVRETMQLIRRLLK